MHKCLKYGLLLCLLLIVIDSTADNLPKEEYFSSEIEQRNFNEEQWQILVNELDYSPNQMVEAGQLQKKYIDGFTKMYIYELPSV